MHPELAGAPPSEYWHEDEASRYHTTPQAARLQAELTQSVVELGGLPCRSGVLLDLGAGGGLSTLTCQALAAARGDAGGPPFVLAVDVSADMLATAAPSEAALAGVRVSGLPAAAGDAGDSADHSVEISEGLLWYRARSDRVLADIGRPLPFRKGVVDGVLSVSAAQWLINGRPASNEESLRGGSASLDPGARGPSSEAPPAHADGGPELSQPRLCCLFRSLRAALPPGGRAALQFYPPKGDPDFGARAMLDAARALGFTADVVLDFPHRSAARKWVLAAQVPSRPEGAGAGCSRWCALCWPVPAGHCALLQSPAPAGAASARSRQQHVDLALRLTRCGRRLRAAAVGAGGEREAADIQARIVKDQGEPLV